MRKIILAWILAFIIVANSIGAETMQSMSNQNVAINAQMSRTGSGYVLMNFTAKSFSSSIDAAFGFDSSDAIPRSLELLSNTYNTTAGNGSVTYYSNWTSMNPSGTINASYDGKDRWFIFSGLGVIANKTYTLRMWLDVSGNGKYDIAMKLSSDTIQSAISNNRFYLLDPWFSSANSSFKNEWCFNQNPCPHRYGNVSYIYTDDGSTFINLIWQGSTTSYREGGANQPALMNYSAAFPYSSSTSIGVNNNGGLTTRWVGMAYKLNNTMNFTINLSSNNPGVSGVFVNSTAISACNYTNAGNCSVRIMASANSTILVIIKGFNSASLYDIYSNMYDVYRWVPEMTITLDRQLPSNITLGTIITSTLNISYNYSTTAGNNLTKEIMFYNITTGDGKPCIFVNGTSQCRTFNTTSVQNTSSTLLYRLFDFSLIPASYNYDEQLLEGYVHLNSTMQDYLKIEIHNISNTRRYGFLEIMVSNTSGAILPIYYCNTTYSSGKPENSGNCIQFGSITPKAYDHIHSNFSSHYIVPLNIVNGSINGIGITSTGYFIMPGSSGWLIHYISNVSRPTSTMISNNQGNTYSSISGTADAHIHQLTEGNDTLRYWSCVNQTGGDQVCSSVSLAGLGISSLPPSAPIVVSPTNITYNGSILINYTSASSITGQIIYYSIVLEDSSHIQVYTISANNTLNLNYSFNSSVVSNDNYYVKVIAYDNQSLSSAGESPLFTIYNPLPSVPIAAGDAIVMATDRFFFIMIILLAILTYFFSFFVGTIGSLVLKLMSFFLFMSSGAFVPDAKFTYGVIAFSSLVMIHLVVHLVLIASGDVDA